MPAPTTTDEFLELVRKSGVVDEKRLSSHVEKLRAEGQVPPEPGKLAGILIRDGILTRFQAEQFLQGRWRRFTIGKYKVLEQIAAGGMGTVYLCEHKFMRRRAAVKILPRARAGDPSALERFYREARAVAALDHPNIVRAYDIDEEDNLHFLVMEYVDGSSLQELVKKSGPLDPARAAHYISQASMGLQHAHEVAGLVHRDIKPGNLIVDRGGTVKILDMGLARFFNDQDDLLTQKYDENVLGTADYLAPEQALDSHGVDIRADIYSLGATLYYCLTGRTPFSDGTVAQKLIWHQTRQPKPIRSVRQDVPEGILAVVDKMMAKDPAQRYQLPIEVAQALTPWTQASVAPPAEAEMPQLSPAATVPSADFDFRSPTPTPARSKAAKTAKAWQVGENPASAAPGASKSPGPAPSNRLDPYAKATAAPVESMQAAEEPLAPTILAPIGVAGGNEDTRFSVSSISPSAPGIEEESLPWENLTAETKNLTGDVDTASPPPKKSSSQKLGGGKTVAAPILDRRRLWWVVGGVSGAALLILVILLWLAFSGNSRDTSRKVKQPPHPSRLIVSRSGQENSFPTIIAAAAKAKPWDHIVLAEPIITEQLTLSDAKHLTIEAAPDVAVVWRCLDKPANVKEILYMSNCEGLHLEGISFDGRDQVDEILNIFGSCPGLTLKNLHLQGFKKYGIFAANCAGRSGKEVLIQDVQISATNDADAALAFFAYTNVAPNVPKISQFFAVRDCRFEGNYAKPVLFNPNPSALDHLTTWENNTYKSKKDISANQLSRPK